MKKNLFAWLFYDVGNSFLMASLGGMYLAQWVVIDNKFDDIWYGGTFALATLLVLIFSPFLGAWSDGIGKRLPFIKWLTLAIILFAGLLAFTAISNIPVRLRVLTVLGLAVIVQCLYQMSLIFYNSLLETVSTEKNRGRVCGLGEAFNNIGWILATAVFLLFAEKKLTLIGEPGRAQVFLPAFLALVIFSLPLLFLFREKPRIKTGFTKIGLAAIYKKTIGGFKKLFSRNKNVAIFLIGFSLVSDAILTFQLYFAITMESIYKMTDTNKFVILALMFFSLILASYFLGKLSDRIGSKKIIILSCVGLIIVFSIAFLSSNPITLWFVAVFAGVGWAGYYVGTRALMVKISPPAQLGEYFGLYSTFQRFASIFGPLIWGACTLLLKNEGVFKYRVAGLALAFVMLAGTILLFKVKEESYVSPISG